jgi:hypothetical protein
MSPIESGGQDCRASAAQKEHRSSRKVLSGLRHGYVSSLKMLHQTVIFEFCLELCTEEMTETKKDTRWRKAL